MPLLATQQLCCLDRGSSNIVYLTRTILSWIALLLVSVSSLGADSLRNDIYADAASSSGRPIGPGIAPVYFKVRNCIKNELKQRMTQLLTESFSENDPQPHTIMTNKLTPPTPPTFTA